MMYVDELRPTTPSAKWPFTQSCHLKADTAEELHAFAQKIGLKRAWAQTHHINEKLHHYDLTPYMRQKAVKHGATELTNREAAARLLARGMGI